jgi:hypothetical protein
MPDIQFKKTLIDTIKDLLADNLPTGYFQKIFYGDPLLIPSSLLPCIAIEKLHTKIKVGPTGMDKIITTVKINLMYNKKEDFGKTDDEVLGVRKIEEYAEAVDETTGEFDSMSVMGILRKNFTMGNVVLDQDVDINYGIVPRPGNELTAECQIQVSFTQLKIVSSRT